MTIRVATEDDAPDVWHRLYDASGINYDVGTLVTEYSLVILGDEGAIMRTQRDGDAWYVQHVWGRSDQWLPLIQATAAELRRRGDGAVPVRWRWESVDNLALKRAVRPLRKRTLIVYGREYDEISSDEELEVSG